MSETNGIPIIKRSGERIKRDLVFALTMHRFPATSVLHLPTNRHLRAAPVVIVFLMCFIVFAESFLAGFPKWYVCLLAYAFSSIMQVQFIFYTLPHLQHKQGRHAGTKWICATSGASYSGHSSYCERQSAVCTLDVILYGFKQGNLSGGLNTERHGPQPLHRSWRR